jgi:hypothetical protein
MDHAAPAWPAGDPLAVAFRRFELLPSLLFHPSRVAEWLPPDASALGAGPSLHRHASAGLLRRLGLGRITQPREPALAVCMAPDALFNWLVLAGGLVLLGPMLRRVIARDDVRRVREQVGTDGLRFARAAGPLWDGELAVTSGTFPDAGLPGEVPATGLRAEALRLGEALAAAAMDAGTPPVARRGLLRLPADAPMRASALPPPLQSPDDALALVRAVLHELDPTWLSSFPDPR